MSDSSNVRQSLLVTAAIACLAIGMAFLARNAKPLPTTKGVETNESFVPQPPD